MKKLFTLIALALGVIAIYSCGGDDPSPKPPVIVKPEPEPPKPKEPVLTITQVPEGQIAWGQSATITITSENAKFLWKGDSVTTATFELKYLLKDTTFSIEAKGYKTISKSHTIDVSTPSEYEKLIVGAWQLAGDNIYRPNDPDDLSKGYHWSDWRWYNDICADIMHYSVDKRIRIEMPCGANDGGSFIIDGGIHPYVYEIRTDSVARQTLEHSGNLTRDPGLIHYPEVIVKLTKDTLIILQEIKPHALSSGWRTHMRIYIRRNKIPYAFPTENGGIGSGARFMAGTQKFPVYSYKEGKGLVRL